MTGQTPSLDSLCETIRELLPKVTPGPWRIGEHEHGYGLPGHSPIDGCNWGALAQVVTRMSYDDHDNAEGVANAALIALAPTMATALLSLASERAKQEAGSLEADIDALCRALWPTAKHWTLREPVSEPPLSYRVNTPRACMSRIEDRTQMRAFIASQAWQAASKVNHG